MISQDSITIRPRWWLLAVSLPSVLLALYYFTPSHVVDHAFILYRYVDHISIGHGLVYNPGEYVEGFASPPWLFLLSFFHMMGLAAEQFAPILGLLCTLIAVVFLGLFVHKRLQLSYAYVAISCLTVTSAWPVVYWSGAGLETSLFLCLILATCLWFTKEVPLKGSQGILCALLAFFLAAGRPEGIVYAFTAMLFASWKHYKDRGKPLHSLTAWLTFFLLTGVSLSSRWMYYSDYLPNIFYAKVTGGTDSLSLGLQYLWSFATQGMGGLLLLFSLCGIVLYCFPKVIENAQRRTNLLATYALTFAGIAFILSTGGDPKDKYQMLVHLLPLLAIQAVATASFLEHRIPKLSLPLVLMIPFFTAAPALHHPNSIKISKLEDRWEEVGREISSTLPPHTRMATDIAGRVPYHARVYTIDLRGITNREVARNPVHFKQSGRLGFYKYKASILLSHKPDLIYFSALDSCPPKALQRWQTVQTILQGTSLKGYASLLASPAFRRLYIPATLQLRAKVYTSFLIRKRFAARLGLRHPRIRQLAWKNNPAMGPPKPGKPAPASLVPGRPEPALAPKQPPKFKR